MGASSYRLYSISFVYITLEIYDTVTLGVQCFNINLKQISLKICLNLQDEYVLMFCMFKLVESMISGTGMTSDQEFNVLHRNAYDIIIKNLLINQNNTVQMTSCTVLFSPRLFTTQLLRPFDHFNPSPMSFKPIPKVILPL